MAMVVAGDGAELYAETHGEGLPVVFSCALCTTHVNWAPQVEALVAAGMQVILWDYRGHGNSSVPTDAAAYSIERVIDDLGCVLDWLRRVVLRYSRGSRSVVWLPCISPCATPSVFAGSCW